MKDLLKEIGFRFLFTTLTVWGVPVLFYGILAGINYVVWSRGDARVLELFIVLSCSGISALIIAFFLWRKDRDKDGKKREIIRRMDKRCVKKEERMVELTVSSILPKRHKGGGVSCIIKFNDNVGIIYDDPDNLHRLKEGDRVLCLLIVELDVYDEAIDCYLIGLIKNLDRV